MIPSNPKVPINMRADENIRNLIDKAAALLHKDRTSFILDTMRREAENLILDQRIFKVDQAVFEKLTEMLDAPLSENHDLVALLNSRAPWEK